MHAYLTASVGTLRSLEGPHGPLYTYNIACFLEGVYLRSDEHTITFGVQTNSKAQ